jgi:hypothetical protein
MFRALLAHLQEALQEVVLFAPANVVFGHNLFWYMFSDSSIAHRFFQPFNSQWLLYVPAGSTLKNYPLCSPQIVFKISYGCQNKRIFLLSTALTGYFPLNTQ